MRHRRGCQSTAILAPAGRDHRTIDGGRRRRCQHTCRAHAASAGTPEMPAVHGFHDAWACAGFACAPDSPPRGPDPVGEGLSRVAGPRSGSLRIMRHFAGSGRPNVHAMSSRGAAATSSPRGPAPSRKSWWGESGAARPDASWDSGGFARRFLETGPALAVDNSSAHSRFPKVNAMPPWWPAF